MLIGTKIKIIREENGLSQAEMADALYVSPQAISNWERGKSYPEISTIIRISELYEISLDDFILEDMNYTEILRNKKLDQQTELGFKILFMIALSIFIGYSVLHHAYNGFVWTSIGYVVYLGVKVYMEFKQDRN